MAQEITQNSGASALLKQIARFMGVGVCAVGLDILIFTGLTLGLGVDKLVANAISFLIATVVNYLLSTRFVFSAKRRGFTIMLGFILLAACGLCISEVLLWLFTDHFKLLMLVAKVLASLIAGVFNFVSRKAFLEGWRPQLAPVGAIVGQALQMGHKKHSHS